MKEVDKTSNKFLQWYGRRSIEYQAKGMAKLGDRSPSFKYKNNRLISRDAGPYQKGNFWGTWLEGSKRLGTPMNDIRPRNIGSSGLIFDPALDPIARAMYWTATGMEAAYVGLEIKDSLEE